MRESKQTIKHFFALVKATLNFRSHDIKIVGSSTNFRINGMQNNHIFFFSLEPFYSVYFDIVKMWIWIAKSYTQKTLGIHWAQWWQLKSRNQQLCQENCKCYVSVIHYFKWFVKMNCSTEQYSKLYMVYEEIFCTLRLCHNGHQVSYYTYESTETGKLMDAYGIAQTKIQQDYVGFCI